MDPRLMQLTEAVRHGGSRQYAHWDGQSFDGWCRGPVQRVWELLAAEADADRDRALNDFLVLIQEGIGRGYLGEPTGEPRDFAEALFCQRLPEWLPQIPVAERGPLLAAAWNIAEGVACDAPWLDQYLLARLTELTAPGALDTQVTELLAPVLEPLAAVSWRGPARVSILDTCSADEEFLPGPMHWIAPRVLCVSDRRREANLGILLTSGQASLVGPIGNVVSYQHDDALPALHWEPGLCRIAEHTIQLPFFDEPMTHAVSPGGYLVASTANSQRLWIVESF